MYLIDNVIFALEEKKNSYLDTVIVLFSTFRLLSQDYFARYFQNDRPLR